MLSEIIDAHDIKDASAKLLASDCKKKKRERETTPKSDSWRQSDLVRYSNMNKGIIAYVWVKKWRVVEQHDVIVDGDGRSVAPNANA